MQSVGRYRILEQIGEGAMARVYRAEDPSIGREIAIKILKSELCRQEEVKTRFIREARAAGALSHAGIVTIHDVGEADGHPYIAMELLDGEPLDDVIRRRGKVPLLEVLSIGEQLALALDYAHRLGIVHRDVKPSNIILCDGGRTAKILDFGIARISTADRVRAELAMLSTHIGQVLGTPRYMSPEQAVGAEIDHRSDLFSLGAVLYELIAGTPAFDGGSLASVAIQITREKPSGLPADSCPKGLQFIVERLLAKTPDRRFANGAQVAEALARERRILSGEEGGQAKLLSFETRRTVAMGAITAAALAVSITWVNSRQHDEMEQMALTSGDTVAKFVANNLALRAAENAALPEAEQDWMPVQAFVESAANDPNLRSIMVFDRDGRIRGSSRPELLGRSKIPPQVSSGKGSATQAPASALWFTRDIIYAGRTFGRVQVAMDRRGLDAAAAATRNLLMGLGLVIFLVVSVMTYASGRRLASPLRRLKAALRDASTGQRFRISHNRSDEFGAMFDEFNSLMVSIEQSTEDAVRSAEHRPSLDATRIEMSATNRTAPSFMRAGG